MTKVGWYAVDKSTPLESNKSRFGLFLQFFREAS